MLGIIYKNLLECRKDLLIGISAFVVLNVLSFITVTVNADSNGSVSVVASFLFIMSALMTYIIIGEAQGSFFSCDQNFRFYLFTCSLSHGQLKLVAAKYIAMFVISVIETGAFLLTALILDVWSMWPLIIAFLIIQLFVRAIEVPFMARFGEKSVKLLKGALFGGVILVVMIYLLYGDISWIKDIEISAIMNFVDRIMNDSAVQTGYLIAIGAVVTVLYVISAFISARLVRKGSVKYDDAV